MAAPTYVPITPAVLVWAIDQADVTEEEVAKRCKVEADVVDSWQRGEAQPTKTQFNSLVDLLRRPVAFFFLPEPPEGETIPAAFRSAQGDDERKRLLRKEAASIRLARRLQRVSKWVLEKEGTPAEVGLPAVSRSEPIERAADRVRVFLSWSLEEQRTRKTVNEVVRAFRATLEDSGFIVLHLPLSQDGCRGFSLYDTHAPVIAVNTAYNDAARFYSYSHELGHLALHSDGICSGRVDEDEERWCEEFAAALLMPREEVQRFVRSVGGRGTFETARALSTSFRVSLKAAAIRLIDLGYATWALFREVQERSDYKRKGGGGGGERTPEKRLREWGARYPRLLIDAEEQDLLTRQDVLEYMNLSNPDYSSLRQVLGTSAGTSSG